jgi:peptidoglycan/LPS O-acetylase OafA/YrhL
VAALTVSIHHFDMAFWNTRKVTIHSHWTSTLLMLLAHYAVDVFIVLSGYCLMIPVAQTGGMQSLSRFIKRRALRILPPYYAALALSIGLLFLLPTQQMQDKGSAVSSVSVISHIFLLHNLNVRWILDINGVLWSIATEWQIYFIFALALIPCYKRYGGGVTAVAACIISAAPWALFPGFHKVERACFWYIGLFALGMWAANMNFAPSERGNRSVSWRWWLAAWIGTIAFSFPTFNQLHVWLYPSMFPWADVTVGLLTALTLIHVTQSVQSGHPSPTARLLSTRAAVGIGVFSYSLYLINSRVVERAIIRPGLLNQGIAVEYVFSLLIAISVVLATAYLFYLCFERPFIKARG